MAERKVLNKYYPPDFDPAKLPRSKKPKNPLRNMIPFTIYCCTCNNYMYRGTKFNMRKELVQGEAYLGEIQVYRFYFKCSRCSAEIIMKTDPKNHSYVMENGAFCAHTVQNEAVNPEKEKKTDDPFKAIENSAMNSKKEYEIKETIDELQSMKQRRSNVGLDAIRAALQNTKNEQEMKEDELLVKSIKFKNESVKFVPRMNNVHQYVKPDRSKNKTVLPLKRKPKTNPLGLDYDSD